MKLEIKLSIALVMSLMLVACGGGGSSDPVVKTEKVWKLVEKSASLDSPRAVFEYDGSGLLLRQLHKDRGTGTFVVRYYKFSYNDQGFLVKKELFTPSDELIRWEEFDQYGEATKRLEKKNGVFKETIVYVNKYPDDLDINNKETQKEIREYVQRKILATWLSNELSPYLGSKINSRVREVTFERIEKFDFHGNEKRVRFFEYPDDGVADAEFTSVYDKYGVRLFGRKYDYEEDENGNLKVKTDKATGSRVYYTWEQMDVPVQ